MTRLRDRLGIARYLPDSGVEEDGDLVTRWGPLRRLTLKGPRGTFLDRLSIEGDRAGVYLHRIVDADPGLDLHDHPWSFVSIVLRGGYSEERIDARNAVDVAAWSEIGWEPGEMPRGAFRHRRRWSVGRFHLGEAHRITRAEPGTWTLVLRGRKVRAWGFYTPDGWVDQLSYDYATRRPCSTGGQGR